MSAVGITNENQSIISETITGFMNAKKYRNEAVSSSESPHMNGNNATSYRQDTATSNHTAQKGGQNTNNRDDMSQLSYNHFGNINNCLHRSLAKVTTKEVNMAWD